MQTKGPGLLVDGAGDGAMVVLGVNVLLERVVDGEDVLDVVLGVTVVLVRVVVSTGEDVVVVVVGGGTTTVPPLMA